jgi:hypothetical protein
VKTSAPLVAVAAIISSMAGGSSREEAVVPDVVGIHVQSASGQLRSAGFAIQIDEPIDLSAASVSDTLGVSGPTRPTSCVEKLAELPLRELLESLSS